MLSATFVSTKMPPSTDQLVQDHTIKNISEVGKQTSIAQHTANASKVIKTEDNKIKM
jgi:hypothetical protein